MGTTPDRVKGTSTTAGTGSATIIDPTTAGLRSLTAHYLAGTSRIGLVFSGPSGQAPTYFERVVGDFNGTTKVFTRASVLRSSNSDNLVNLPAGTHDVFPYWPVGAIGSRQVPGSTTVALDDWGDMLEFTGAAAATWTLQAVANVPDGYSFGVNHLGTGASVLTLSGATIDGGSSIAVVPGESFWIKKLTASNYRTIGRARGWIPLDTIVPAGAAAVEFLKFFDVADFDSFKIAFDLRPATNDVYLKLLVGVGGGAYHASGYSYAHRIFSASGADADSDHTADATTASINLTRAAATAGVGNLAAEHIAGEIVCSPFLLAGVENTLFRFSTEFVREDGVLGGSEGRGMMLANPGFPMTKAKLEFSNGIIASGVATLYGRRR